ncbi:Hypothetical predicted protein [Pelobates cultripes]|uniref:Uncharacterized protein n=1 Tax=Pelobates cultripes TaxID=61616 RepID=A0AAD1WGL1_PELCU|nr:Hypothetical predicted protein [Pelobates cultripes]
MAQQKGKKIPERADKSGFFTARSAPNRAQGQHDVDQDGGGDDTLPLQNSPDPGNLPFTQEILRACLDKIGRTEGPEVMGLTSPQTTWTYNFAAASKTRLEEGEKITRVPPAYRQIWVLQIQD